MPLELEMVAKIFFCWIISSSLASASAALARPTCCAMLSSDRVMNLRNATVRPGRVSQRRMVQRGLRFRSHVAVRRWIRRFLSAAMACVTFTPRESLLSERWRGAGMGAARTGWAHLLRQAHVLVGLQSIDRFVHLLAHALEIIVHELLADGQVDLGGHMWARKVRPRSGRTPRGNTESSGSGGASERGQEQEQGTRHLSKSFERSRYYVGGVWRQHRQLPVFDERHEDHLLIALQHHMGYDCRAVDA